MARSGARKKTPTRNTPTALTPNDTDLSNAECLVVARGGSSSQGAERRARIGSYALIHKSGIGGAKGLVDGRGNVFQRVRKFARSVDRVGVIRIQEDHDGAVAARLL